MPNTGGELIRERLKDLLFEALCYSMLAYMAVALVALVIFLPLSPLIFLYGLSLFFSSPEMVLENFLALSTFCVIAIAAFYFVYD